MKKATLFFKAALLGTTCFLVYESPLQAATFSDTSPFHFTTVVNNGDNIPGTNRLFNSYNQPSVNSSGLVVFRARSRGGQGGQPSTGIFSRDLLNLGSIEAIATRGSLVPEPNNTSAEFTEFPSFPRIDIDSSMTATRGQSNPVWQVIDPVTGETVTQLGTSGIYTNPMGELITGASQLGEVSGFDYFSVPSSSPTTRFDQFPGAPAPTDGSTIVFKGNWTDQATGEGKTGVYFRDVLANGGTNSVELIADSNTVIPGNNPTGILFGSTAPPSAARGNAVFLGVDNEESPTLGGIYQVSLLEPRTLNPLVSLGETAPGSSLPFTRLGEALSFDGNYLAFWGALGSETKPITLFCPEEGNQARVDYCQSLYPNGFTTEVAANQGIFLTNTETLETQLIAQTGEEGFSDFLFWNFSGRPPGVGEGEDEEGDLELARWRSTAFVAVDGSQITFKGSKDSGIEGIYALLGLDSELLTVVDTSMLGEVLDPEATGLTISSVGIERDGYRDGWLALTASMVGDAEEDSWAGIYVTRTATVPEPSFSLLTGAIVFALGLRCKRKSRP
ncbi:DUF7453 family protein [Coleofasciculus sp. G1-WW12-02]|uniref:DUF7453 family protein n=1 Tax=Coleofasciculus TaxID=669368 RepID=UPI0032F5634E